MRRRLFLLFLPCVYVPVSIANEALWNCSQNKDSKEWVCVGEKKPVDKTGEIKASATAEPVKEVLPAPVEAVESTQPNVAEPETAKPSPAPVENAEVEPIAPKLPVSTKTDKDIQQANVEPKQPAPSVPVDSTQTKLLQTEANHPGWTCDSKAADKNWNCKLVGNDPKGQARVIETYESGISLLTPAFDQNEEQTFSNLKSQLKYDPWQNCAAPSGTKPGFVPEKDLREVSPLDINSDYAEIFDNEIYSYTGNVEMVRADQHSVSNKASYDTVSETLDLQGSVYYNEDELALHSESASLNLATDRARLRDALFISPAAPLRGRAQTIYRESNTLSRYKDVAYTSCRPGNQDWVVHATELKMNKTTGQGAAKNAWLEFKGTPVFYSPYLSFPIDDRRLSGFLAPSFGSTQRGGISLSTPYYWNIAPNYDATLRPRYLSDRGIILGGSFRYLTERSSGSTNLEFVPHDSLFNKTRYLAGVKNITQFSPHISSNLDLNYVSDKYYFSDLGNALSTSTYSSYLLSQANLIYANTYKNTGVSLRGHVDNYQSIDPAITSAGLPYRRLPQVNLNLNHSFNFMPLNTLMDAEYVFFQHNTLVNGQRTNVKPSVSLPLQTASAFLTPKISLQHTQYSLSDPKGTAPLTSDSLSRTLPIFSTDTGLFLEKDLILSNRSYLHTLEPRLFYVYIPTVNQNNFPIFDTSFYDPSFNSLFLENRFSGSDRVGDANQLTAAITTRLVETKSGKEKLKLSVGQTVYFQDREVILPGYQEPLPGYFPNTDRFSNLVAELNAGLTDHISLSSGMQWNPHLNDIVRYAGGLHYLNKPDINRPGEIVNLGYRYRKNTIIPDTSGQRLYDIIQSDASFHWPVYNDWSAVGRWTYSLLNNSTQESFLGVEKENCCWTFRFIGRRWINSVNLNTNPNIQNSLAIDTTATGIPQTGVFVEVELKGLTGVGEKLDQFFEKQIYGYRASQK
ncbi:LPS assembly protein LptD [Methylobacter sp.]|uniref:LPS assembly protein LptD n=1 Tax=Methylobacter sp. TaxID=2051955 RepID=UPI0012244FB3|nr:LPS assembly protein LptD [Methylobacter sp.]TAK61426.1 MAG: LPS-assembly protein LptD [Methylobacter sp.]